MEEMARFIIYSPADAFVQELSQSDVFSAIRTEELNGQNSLELTTSTVLHREQRVLVHDATGVWREYVVMGVDEAHEAAERAIGTYYCEWSLQHDLQQLAVENKQPGFSGSKVTASSALRSLIAGTGSKRWGVGTVTVATTGGASFYHESAWEALSDLVKEWGGEVVSEIGVDSQGVITRKVSLLAHRGSLEATRRFDFGCDLKSIKRKVSEDPLYCRIIPLGKGEDLNGDGKGYGSCITISSVNGGKNYLENIEATKAFRLPDGSGGYDYPTLYVKEESIEDSSELLAWGREHLDDYTVPKVAYEGSVIQFAEAGMDIKGLALGDETQCVDKCFHEDAPLRISGRVVKLVVDELAPRDAKVTLGYLQEGFNALVDGMLSGLKTSVSGLRETVKGINGGTLSTADYLNRLVDRLNKEINATGGYTYIKPGDGIWVYDKAEDQNPTQVVRIKGGSISIAGKKKANGEWDWKQMITGKDGILASAVTAAELTTGTIKGGSNSWDLDSGELLFRQGVIRDLARRNEWDLTKGTFKTDSMIATNVDASGAFSCGNVWQLLSLKSGQIQGLEQGKKYSYIDFSAHAIDKPTGTSVGGMQLQADGMIRVASPRVAVAATADIGAMATYGVNATFSNVIYDEVKNEMRIADMKFINGICVQY